MKIKITEKISKLIRINFWFYHDHIDRDCEAPPIERETHTHGGTRTVLWIDPTHPACYELLSDADYYADGMVEWAIEDKQMGSSLGWDVVRGARQVVKALKKAGWSLENTEQSNAYNEWVAANSNTPRR